MYDLAFRIQVMILEFRKNLRYWVLALPIVTLVLFPIVIGATSFIYSFAVNKDAGNLALIKQDKRNFEPMFDIEKHVDLKNGKRLFFTRLNNDDNSTFGFRKFYYTVKFFDINKQEVDKDDTKYENFLLPTEIIFLTHFASSKAETMKIKFLTAESDLVNILPEDLEKYKNPKATELSNLKIDISNDDYFSLNFLVNNTTGKKLQNLKYQYVVTNKASEIVFVSNLTLSELQVDDKELKTISSLSYPVNVPKGELLYIKDNNKMRYNIFEYEK